MTDAQGAAKTHTPEVMRYLRRIYARDGQAHAFRGQDPDDVRAWQGEARPALRGLLGLEVIAASTGGHRPRVELGEPEEMGAYTRRKGCLETEPDVRLPFWLLRPVGAGPFPLAVAPHGHDRLGMDTYVGIAHDARGRQRIVKEDADVAVQAVERGFVAIAPATRGISPIGVPDVTERHGSSDCRSQLIHCLLAGRTGMGERVWDMERLIDWAIGLPEVDAQRILMLGNSGGGMVTTYAAACDTRIGVAAPSCSFTSFVSSGGGVHHCDCNVVPGILRFGDFYDVAGLIAPRYLLTVNGRYDHLHPTSEVDRAVEALRRIYAAAGVPERYQHRYGSGGHRFYADAMWPFVSQALLAA